MLRKTLYGTLAGALLFVSASTANAQFASPIRFNVNAGVALPVGDLSDEGFAELGFHLGAGLEFRGPLMPIGLRFDGAYDRMGIEDADAAYTIWNLTANAVVSPMASPLYFIGGIGFYSTDVSGDDVIGDPDAQTDFGFNLGAGLSLPLTGFSAFVEARYHRVSTDEDEFGLSSISFIPIVFGLRF
jgi:opacity protein-like surface antigen